MEQQLLQEQKSPNALAFKIALLLTIYTLLIIVIMRMLGINLQAEGTPVYQTVVSGILNWVPFIYAIYYIQKTHKQELGGFITYGRAFSAGFKVAAYGGLFIGLCMFLYYQFIDQAGMDQIVDAQIAKAKNEQQVQGIEMMRPYFAVTSGFGAAIMFTISGLIVSLISAAIVKKERPMHYTEAE